jgi:hypothetical protein
MTTTAVGGVPVSMGGVVQRINRALKAKQKALRVARDRWRSDLGTYYIVDYNQNTIVETHVDLEVLARELGALHAWERLTEN